jgi:hypothetical protein
LKKEFFSGEPHSDILKSYYMRGQWSTFLQAWPIVLTTKPHEKRRREIQNETRAGIFKESMGARNRGGIGLSYRPARLHRLVELIPWNRFLGSINVKNTGCGLFKKSSQLLHLQLQ